MIQKADCNSWWLTTYVNDVHEHLKQLETERKVYRLLSPQLDHRINLVHWIKEKSRLLRCSKSCLYQAVYLLDFFMDSYEIKENRLLLVAAVCLTLAAKFQEQDSRTLTVSEINEITGSSYTAVHTIYLEHKILSHFNWKLAVPTVMHFIGYYMSAVIMLEDVYENNESLYARAKNLASRIISKFLDSILEDVVMAKFPPSKVAAACILATRQMLKMKIKWTTKLQLITGFKIEDVLSLSARITSFQKKGRKRKLEHPLDHKCNIIEECTGLNPNIVCLVKKND